MKLRVEKAIYGGAGLARVEGKAVFVPMTLPGEVVEAATKRDKSSFAEAELVAVLEASPVRVAAPCPYYGACGGCQYQHASYTAQLAMKRSILVETLGRAGLRDLPEIATHAGEPWGYRNRIRLHVDAASHALGYRRRGSHALLPMDVVACPIAAPLLEQVLGVLRVEFAERKAGAWCAEVEMFTNDDSSALLLWFTGRPGAGSTMLNGMCEAVREQVPQLVGAGLLGAATVREARHGRKERSAAAEERESAAGPLVDSWGERALEYRVGGDRYGVSLGAFFQGNRFLVEALRTLATDDDSGSVAWDLFAGVGLFARALSKRFEEVVAVEGAPVSAGDLRRNLAGHRVIESSTLSFLSRATSGKKAPELIVLDPPRAGLGTEASALLATVRSQTITYVSCDPATLSRDLRVLVDAGYTITRLDLVDMFPQTFHLETVARLCLR